MAGYPGTDTISRVRRRRTQDSMSFPYVHSDVLMLSSTGSSASAGSFSWIALYNNASTGWYLHIVGLLAWAQGTTAEAVMFRSQGVPSGSVIIPATPVDPNSPALWGQMYFGTAASLPSSPILHMGGNNYPVEWSYDFPVCILQAGYSLYLYANVIDTAVSGSMAWLALQHS